MQFITRTHVANLILDRGRVVLAANKAAMPTVASVTGPIGTIPTRPVRLGAVWSLSQTFHSPPDTSKTTKWGMPRTE